MHILIKNKKLLINNYNVKCAIGKRGITSKKSEGDKCTPRGKFKLKYVFYRKDRVKKFHSELKLIAIKKNFGWCDDISSRHYNKFVTFPFEGRAEKLYLNKNYYDIIIVLDYNLNPIKRNKGSAIFLHVASRSYSPTLGCVAISKSDIILLLSSINKNTFLKII